MSAPIDSTSSSNAPYLAFFFLDVGKGVEALRRNIVQFRYSGGRKKKETNNSVA